MMNIVHIVLDDRGGAGRAAQRICKALEETKEVNSKVVALFGNNETDTIFKSKIKLFLFKLKRKIRYLLSKKNRNFLFYYAPHNGVNIKSNEYVKKADIVHIHWIGGNILGYKQLRWFISNKKVIWTLHDMWAFTAGCYYNGDCFSYKNDICKKCYLVKSDCSKEYLKKSNCFNTIQFVGCSNWITNECNDSCLKLNKKAVCVPNPIDYKVFSPENKKNQINLDVNTKKIILFGAISSDSDPRKGFKYLVEALKLIKRDDVVAVVFGNKESLEIPDVSIPIVSIGKINDDNILANLYSQASVFVAPSVQENLSNAVMESLSCGTPVVAFNIGGMPDLIEHKESGYLAKPLDKIDLASGIDYCLDESQTMGNKAREHVLRNYDPEIIAKKYIDIYREVLNR